MKALSIRPPWPWLIIRGLKPVENRGWKSSYRGPLLIHAATSWEEEACHWLQKHLPTHLAGMPADLAGHHPGCIVGRVEMYFCTTVHESVFFTGPYGFCFKNAVEFKDPVPVRGQLGIFNVPDELITEAGGLK